MNGAVAVRDATAESFTIRTPLTSTLYPFPGKLDCCQTLIGSLFNTRSWDAGKLGIMTQRFAFIERPVMQNHPEVQ